MSKTRKANVRKRLKQVDSVVAAISASGEMAQQLPKESEMPPKDKYTVFSKNTTEKGLYRKSLHKVPHFTKIPLERKSPM